MPLQKMITNAFGLAEDARVILTGVTYTIYIPHLQIYKPECGPMPNVMAALPNIGGALCSTPQSLADAHY